MKLLICSLDKIKLKYTRSDVLLNCRHDKIGFLSVKETAIKIISSCDETLHRNVARISILASSYRDRTSCIIS